MTKSQILKHTEQFVKERLQHEGTGHDWWHIERVRNNAKLIAKTETVDWFVVSLALHLHDVGDRKVINQPEDDYTIAENFLKSQSIKTSDIDHVMFIIKNMSYSASFDTKQVKKTKEFEVVQDADRLDALGAIGIARAFMFGGSKSQPMYNPLIKKQKKNTKSEYRAMSSSTLHHFYEKLFLLKDLMNTKTAKKIAQKRHTVMQNYVSEFLAEWHGKQ